MHFLKINKPLLGVLITIVIAVGIALPRQQPARSAVTMPDFRAYSAGPERKTEFFEFLRPIVAEENRRVLVSRARLEAMAGKPGWRDFRWLEMTAERYGVAMHDDDGEQRPVAELIDELLLRVDAVPSSLALAQAAKESGWGTSRFAREGNNLFGEWCFTDGCGIVPRQRAEGSDHEVEAFASPTESVASYLRNINTHDSYKSFREARKAQREDGGALSGVELANELSEYSERREAYVQELKGLIIGNDLESGDVETAQVAPAGSD